MDNDTRPFIVIRTLIMLATLALLVGIIPARTVLAAGTLYVKASSTCASSCGGSWANAYPKLQDALSAAVSGDQIWVAKGVYYPDEGVGQTNDNRNSTFTLKNEVALYGGFAGTENSLSQRNVNANPTVLSGDIDMNDTTDANGVVTKTSDMIGANAYHVVRATSLASTTTLDGFTITAGQANGTSPNNLGGGMYNVNSNPTLGKLTFSGNTATTNGGGIYNTSSSPTLNNVSFSGNTATTSGGGIYNIGSSPTLSNVTFSGNSSYHGGGLFNDNGSNATLSNVTFSNNSATYGGGMYNYNSNPALTNVTISGNSGASSGGGIRNVSSTLTLKNVIIANSTAGGDCVNNNGGSIGTSSSNNLVEATGSNACDLTNGTNGNIVGQDPKLGPLQNNGGSTLTHALLAGSPAIDAGTNTGCPATDQRGLPRPIDGNHDANAVCDIGAYEFPIQVFLPLLLK